MKFIILIILFTNILFCDPFTLTNEDKKYINTLHNKNKIIKRFSNFKEFFQKAKQFNEIKKLNRVNNYVNRIISKRDVTNEWSNPKEFLIKGRGDCEDYAFAKYFSLKKLNFDSSRLYMAVVKVKGSKSYHMVLMYMNKQNIPMILDNLSWKTLPLSKRKTLKLFFAFNEKGSYTLKNNKLIKEKGIRRAEVKLFRQMLQKSK